MFCLKSSSDAAVMSQLKSLGPSAVDREIRSLPEGQGGSDEVMGHFLSFVDASLRTNRDFELVHSYLALFLKVSYDSFK